MYRRFTRLVILLWACVGLTGCFSRTLIEWRIDAEIGDFIDDVDPPSGSRAEFNAAAEDVKDTLFEFAYDFSDSATALEDELEKEEPEVQRIRSISHRLIDRVKRLPGPHYIRTLRGWYLGLDKQGQARFWSALKQRFDKDEPAKRAAESEEERAKRQVELMDRFALDDAQRRRWRALVDQDTKEREASKKAWAGRQRAMSAAFDAQPPNGEAIFDGLLDGWAQLDTERWKVSLERWLDFYDDLRPDQKERVNDYVLDKLDDIPRLRR